MVRTIFQFHGFTQDEMQKAAMAISANSVDFDDKYKITAEEFGSVTLIHIHKK